MLRFFYGADLEVDDPEASVRFYPQTFVDHVLFPAQRFPDRCSELDPQPLARHVEHVERGLARGRLQEGAGAAVEVEDVAPVVHHAGGRRILLDEEFFHHIADLDVDRSPGPGSGLRFGLAGQGGRVTVVQGDRGAALDLPGAEDLPASVQDGEQVGGVAHGFR